LFDKQIDASETEMASFLVKTPYILLLTVTGFNIVSPARLAGEAGPIEHYATARAINGRAGLHPSRYQSDEVDRRDGGLVRQCNRRLRSAAMLVAENLIKCNAYYRGLSANWAQQKVDPRDRRCRIANRAMRMERSTCALISNRKFTHDSAVHPSLSYSNIQPEPHWGRPQVCEADEVVGRLEPFVFGAALTLNSFSILLEPHAGHSGDSAPRTSTSDSRWHSLHWYS
jgi:hypothetical protein